jgi:glutamate-1-semialdehyde 2,1-aminomutase
LSGNPVAEPASRDARALHPALYTRLRSWARAWKKANRAIKDSGAQACVQRVGSMITLFFCAGPVKSWGDADKADRKRFASFFGGLLRRGVYWPPAQFEAAFISGAHTDDDIDKAIEAARDALSAS